MSRAISLSDFLDRSPSPYHVVSESVGFLENNGAEILHAENRWHLLPGRLYAYAPTPRTLFAFRTPNIIRAKESEDFLRFVIIGAHTDSPCLRIKDRSIQYDKGILVAGTEPYGSAIQSTWLDRDLVIAGAASVNGKIVSVRLPVRAILPNLAIHLNRDINKGFEYNPQTHLRVLIGADIPESERNRVLPYLVTQAMGDSVTANPISPDTVTAFDLYLADAQPSRIFPGEGLLSSPRLDNLAGCHAALCSLIAAPITDAVQLVCLFDHEEIGSRSAGGADSVALPNVMQRIVKLIVPDGDSETWFRVQARSFVVSVDAAHARHPNYPEKHDSDYAPELNRGIVLKSNVNHKYATEITGAAAFLDYCRQENLPIQVFTNRADMGCGSTIGPISTSLVGVQGIDIGIPILAMHSARETAGCSDQATMIKALTAVLRRQ